MRVVEFLLTIFLGPVIAVQEEMAREENKSVIERVFGWY